MHINGGFVKPFGFVAWSIPLTKKREFWWFVLHIVGGFVKSSDFAAW